MEHGVTWHGHLLLQSVSADCWYVGPLFAVCPYHNVNLVVPNLSSQPNHNSSSAKCKPLCFHFIYVKFRENNRKKIQNQIVLISRRSVNNTLESWMRVSSWMGGMFTFKTWWVGGVLYLYSVAFLAWANAFFKMVFWWISDFN